MYGDANETSVEGALDRAIIAASVDNDMLRMHTTWSCAQLELDVWQRRTAEVVTLFGLDPTVATRSDLDALDRRLYCHTCETKLHKPRKVMDWRNMVRTHDPHDLSGGRSLSLLVCIPLVVSSLG